MGNYVQYQRKASQQASHTPVEQQIQALDALLSGSPEQIYVFDRTGKYTYTSPSGAKALGRDQNEIIGKTWRELDLPADLMEPLDAQREAVFASGQALIAETRPGAAPSGRAYEYSLSPIHSPDGDVTAVIATARDITERKSAEESLRFLAEASETLTSALDYNSTLAKLTHLAVPFLADWCAVHVVEPDGSIRQLAVAHPDPEVEAYGAQLGQEYPLIEHHPFGIAQVLRTGELAIYHAIPDTYIEQVAHNEQHLAILRSFHFTSAMIIPLIARGRTHGALTLVTAESGRRYSEEDLILAQELARRAAVAIDNARLFNEAWAAIHLRDEFLSIASHELKSPLTILQLQFESLLRQAEHGRPLSRELLQSKIGSATQQITRIGRLVDDLLDVSQLAAGRLELDRERFDLRDVVRDVVEAAAETIASVDCTVHINAEHPVIGCWDRSRLEQVMTNLLTNALKFCNSKPIQITVTADDNTAHIAVRDQGIGIAPEDLDRIFNRWERAVSQHEYIGSGLGLYIVTKILEAHNGSIHVNSELGVGSTFTVELPRTDPQCPSRTQELSAIQPSALVS